MDYSSYGGGTLPVYSPGCPSCFSRKCNRRHEVGFSRPVFRLQGENAQLVRPLSTASSLLAFAIHLGFTGGKIQRSTFFSRFTSFARCESISSGRRAPPPA